MAAKLGDECAIEHGSSSTALPKKRDFKDVLPRWACDEEVLQLAEGDFKDKPSVPMGLCVGPGLPALKWSLAFIMVTMPPVAYLTSHVSECTKTGWATYPTWLFLLFIPMGVYRWRTEFWCLKYSVVPYYQVVGFFKVGGLNVGFKTWWAFCQFLSFLAVVDICTDCFFVGATFKTESCEGEMITTIWQYVLSQSKYVSWAARWSFSDVILGIFVVSFIQIIFPLAVTTPKWGGAALDYKVGSKDPETGRKYNLEFKNIFNEKINFGNAVFQLAEGAGMAALQQQNPWFPHAKVDEIFESTFRSEDKKISDSLSVLRGELERAVARYGLNALLENALQANMQISILAMSHASQGRTKSIQWQQLFSISIGIFLSLIRASMVFDVIAFYWQVRSQCKERRHAVENYELLWSADHVRTHGLTHGDEHQRAALSRLEAHHTGSSFDQEHGWTVNHEYFLCTTLMCFIVFMWLIFMGLMVYAIVKLFMVFHCENSVWNLDGCVDLSHLHL